MTVVKIAKLGAPVLRQVAEPVPLEEIGKRAFQEFIDDMLEAMVKAEGIGLAAPQVFSSEQVVVMECQGEHGFPRTILINPEILGHSPVTAEGWEGCLSVDGLRGKRSEEHTSELQSRPHLVCRLLLEKKKKTPLRR